MAALTALKLVEERKITLDQSVLPKLKSWHLPPGQQSERFPATLRRLLGMTAGINVHGFGGYPAGAPIPTLVQILNGAKPTVNSEPIRVDSRPGSKEEYSGGGYEMAELLMEDVTGEKFAELARRLVFDRLAMKDSNVSQPLAPEYVPLASEGHNEAAGGNIMLFTIHGGNGRPYAAPDTRLAIYGPLARAEPLNNLCGMSIPVPLFRQIGEAK